MSNSNFASQSPKGDQIPMKLDFKVFNCLDDVKSQWNDLEKSLDNIQFYQTSAWYQSVITLPTIEKDNIFFIVISQQNKILGLLPIEYLTMKKFIFSINVIQFSHHYEVYLYDCLMDKSIYSIALEQLANFLNSHKQLNWDVLSFARAPEGSDLGHIFNASQLSKRRSLVHNENFYLQCKSDYAQTTAHISSKFKRNIRRLQRKAEKQGTLEYISYAYTNKKDIDEFLTYYHRFLDVEVDCWKGEIKSAVKLTQKSIDFYQDFAENLEMPNCCIIHILKLDDVDIAAQFSVKIRNRLTLIRIGSREKYNHLGAGNLILNYTIQYCIDKGIDDINFFSSALWLEKWKSHSVELYRYLLFNNTVMGYLAKFGFGLFLIYKPLKNKWLDYKNKKLKLKGYN